MKKKSIKNCITGVIAIILTSLWADAVSAKNNPAVLFVGSAARHMHTWNDWLDSGFEIAVNKTAEIKSLHDISSFNTVVVNFLPQWGKNDKPKPELIRFRKILDQYMKKGGGVVVFCGGGQWSGMAPSVSYLLKPYGASVPEEQVIDTKHRYPVKAGSSYKRFSVCYTTKIAQAPMTKGIKRIGFIGEASRADCMKTSQPVILTDPKPWHVVVRGEKSAYSAEGLKPGTTSALKKTPASYASEPILAAWRTVGKGNLFVYPQNVAFTVATPEVFENVLWQKNVSKKEALQNRQLIMQTVRWAAQPSLKSGKLGGFKTDRNIPFDRKAILNLKPIKTINWSKVKTSGKFGSVKGLVGAQSKYSGGKYSITELSKSAKASGLSFLAFTEALEKLDPAKWEKFKNECIANSNDKFLAIPGILGKDKVGNLWFGLGHVKFPKYPAITKDGKRLDNTYQFWAKQFNTRLGAYVNPLSNPNKWYEMKQTSGMSVISKIEDKPVEKAFDEYLLSCSKAENLIPFRFSMLNSPQDIKEAAKGIQNIFTGNTVDELKDYVDGAGNFKASLFWANSQKWYLSEGPELIYHGGYNLGNFNTDEEKQNLFRYVLKLGGLKSGDKIILFDGGNKYREWLASEKDFNVERTWPLQQRRDFVIEVRRNNKVVMLSAPLSLHYGSRFMQCGDRQNTLPYNYTPDRKGNYYVSGITIGAHYRSWTPDTLVYGNFKAWLSGADGIEYQPPFYVSYLTSPHLPLAGKDMVNGQSLASYQFPKLSCPGIIIVDEICNRMYPDNGRHLGDCHPPKKTVPLETFRFVQRRYGLYGMINQVNAQLVESTLTMLKDCTLSNSRMVVSNMSYPVKADSPKKAEVFVDGKITKYPFNNLPDIYRNDNLKPGDYYGLYPHGLAGGGAQYAVSDSLQLRVNYRKNAKSLSCVIYKPLPKILKKGSQIKYNMLFSTGGLRPAQKNSDFMMIDDFLGVRNSKYPAITQITGGRLENKPVIATITAMPDKILKLETRKCPDAPLALPIRIRGFNPNWLTVYKLNGSKIWRYCGELDNDLYFHLYTSISSHKVVMGHPLTADNKDVIITLDCPDGKQSQFEIYNPSSKKMTVKLKTNPLLLPEKSLVITINPLESKRVRIK